MIIYQKDIPNFHKNSNISENLDAIFNKSYSLEEEIIDNKLIIILSDDIYYLHPLFLIHLMNIQKRKNLTLIIDIVDARKETQQYILRYLSQYTDTELVKTYPKETYNSITRQYENADNDIHNNLLLKPKAREDKHLKITDDKKVHFFYTESMKKSILKNENIKLNLLPILQLKKHYEYKDVDISDVYEKIGDRIDFYNDFDIELDYNNYKKKLTENIDNLLNILSINKSLNSTLTNVFAELIDNIKRYTQENSNGYISLFHNIMLPINQTT